jgi:hypothetical protein
MTIADFCDWLTITQIKKQRPEIDNGSLLIRKIEKIKNTMTNHKGKRFLELVNKLYFINIEIWELMDDIAMESDLEKTGKAAKLLIEVNCKRVCTKNEISRFFDVNRIEHKNYGQGIHTI